MIPYADLDRAIARWKNRKSGDGGEIAASDVVGEVPEEMGQETSSGLIQLGDEDQLDES